MTDRCAIEVGGDGCAFFDGTLSFDTVPAVYRETERLLLGNNPINCVDLSKLTRVDSAGLTLLLEWEAIQRKVNRRLVVRNAPPELMSLARLCEADEVMTLSGRDQPS